MQKVFSKREKFIFYFTFGLIIFSLIFNFMLAPILRKSEQLSREIKISKVKLKKYALLLKQKDAIQNKYDKFKTASSLPMAGKDTSLLALSELETLAKDANILITDVRPEAAHDLSLYKEIIVDLRTEGTMENYIKFLYNIENSLSLIRIKKFQLNVKPNSQNLEGIFTVSQLSVLD